MKNKIILLVALLGAATVWAADNVLPKSGVVRELQSVRWSETRVAATSSNVAVVATASIQAYPGMVRSITLVPGSTSDTFTIYNSSVANQAAGLEVFTANPQKAANFTVGLPVTYDLPATLDCSTAISVSLTSNGTTTNTARLFVSYGLNQ